MASHEGRINFQKVFLKSRKPYEGMERRVAGIIEAAGSKVTKNPTGADLAVIIGGDGTFLYNRLRLSCPIVGIKTPNHVGYYLRIGSEDFEGRIRKILQGVEGKDFFIHSLPCLAAEINGKVLGFTALNEMLIGPIYTRRMFECEVWIEGKESFERNSGVIFFTPTGWHGFASSAGAKPIHFSRIGLVAVAPYAGILKKGSVELGAEIRIRCLNREAEICADGIEESAKRLGHGDEIVIRKAAQSAKVIGFERNF